MSRHLTPPPYCKDAIPTPKGWMDPKTKEILVSVRNLVELLKEAGIQITPPGQKYPGARRGPKPKKHLEKEEKNEDDFDKQVREEKELAEKSVKVSHNKVNLDLG